MRCGGRRPRRMRSLSTGPTYRCLHRPPPRRIFHPVHTQAYLTAWPPHMCRCVRVSSPLGRRNLCLGCRVIETDNVRVECRATLAWPEKRRFPGGHDPTIGGCRSTVIRSHPRSATQSRPYVLVSWSGRAFSLNARLRGPNAPSISHPRSASTYDKGENSMLWGWKLPFPLTSFTVVVFIAKVSTDAATASELTSSACRLTLSKVSQARW